ncbi:MAG: hypothetical protein ACR2QK_18075 [Acidimicrobiales bacterium]
MAVGQLIGGRAAMTSVEREAAMYRRETRFRLSRSLGLLLTLMAFVVGARTMTDNSLLTHLATGERILDLGSVPDVDIYSYTAAGESWTVQSWLISLVYAVVGDLGGLSAVRALHGVVAAAIGVGVWQLVAPARQIVPRFGLAMVPLFLGAQLWSPRPLLFGLLAMVAVLQVAQLNRPVWILLPIMWLWVNSHGSFPLAVVLLGAVAAGAWIDERARPDRELRLLAWAGGGILLGLLNPVGLRLLWFPVQLLGRREALDRVVEWQAPSFTNWWELLFLALLPVVVLAATRGTPWRAMLPAITFLVAGLLAVRNIAVAAIVIVAVLAPTFREFYGAEDGTAVSLVSRLLGRAAIVGLVVSLIAVLAQPGLDLDLYPIDEVDFLEARDLVANDEVNLIHREAVGNYLTYRYGDRASVFIDDRFDFYPLDVTADHLTLLYGGDYAEVLDRRGADVVLWAEDGLLADWLAATDRWDIVLDGEDWIVACRTAGPIAERCGARG